MKYNFFTKNCRFWYEKIAIKGHTYLTTIEAETEDEAINKFIEKYGMYSQILFYMTIGRLTVVCYETEVFDINTLKIFELKYFDR